ncbi:MAG: cation transporter [Melioribacteraceae bacterium]|nr:cation transporter [Melioribacteraceae bacterium]
MTCHHCVKAVVMELDKLDVNSHQVDIGEVIVEYDENKVDEKQIVTAIEEAGYKVVN